MCNLQIIDVVSEMFEERATGKYIMTHIYRDGEEMTPSETVKLLNEQQATISQLQEEIKLLKPTNIEQYEQIVQLQEENERLRLELDTHKHPLWSTREAERKLSEVTNNLANEVKKNGLLNEEINQLRIENMRLKDRIKVLEK